MKNLSEIRGQRRRRVNVAISKQIEKALDSISTTEARSIVGEAIERGHLTLSTTQQEFDAAFEQCRLPDIMTADSRIERRYSKAKIKRLISKYFAKPERSVKRRAA